ncbi:MAG TPA: 6,7-dimethyl-8-ribityllumazine synthase [Terriglobales bacterium]|jgi:6,7-dimethyl-8-ribityllumazine synthase|nr:6,7-dimethyl-8-ribityllumazine synthase [Terriglobales bacterium]
MLKSLHIGRYVSDPKDLRVLAEFLRAIGFETVAGEDGRSAIFSAPLALFSLNSLGKEYPAEVRERLKDVNRLLVLEVTNPEAVFEIAEKRKFKLLADSSNTKTNDRSFSLELPGEIVLTIHGRPEEATAATEGQLNAAGKRFAIVASRFNAFITERLLQSAYDGLLRTGANKEDIALIRVPGAFEIPSAARTLAETKKYDAIICIGCLLRGDTAHYDVIVNEVTRGIGQSAQETGVPHAFGVLTCETLEQAIDRAGLKMGNKGLEAALAAVEMANLKRTVVGRRSLVVGKNKGKSKKPKR